MSDPDLTQARREMLAQIRRHAAELASATGLPVPAEGVLEALSRVPRHRFVPPAMVDQAYADRPLSIGHGQTISQPYMVALMTHALRPDPESRILDIGTGSGYQTAVLAEIAGAVYTLELVAPLAERARHLLEGMGYDNIHYRVGDGHQGWPEAAPFDGILVAAAAEAVPPALLDQLAPGARLLIPIGMRGGMQELRQIERLNDGSLQEETLLPVAFVPLVRGRSG